MYQRVLVPIDGSDFSEEILPYAATIAEANGADLEVVRAIENPAILDKANRQLNRIDQRWGSNNLIISGRGDVPTAIQEEADRVPQTLLAMTTRGRSGLAEALLGSVAHEIVRASTTPVLVYHPDAAARHQGERMDITTIVLPIDGSERVGPIEEVAGAWAKTLGAELELVQVLRVPFGVSPQKAVTDPNRTAYIRSHAETLGRRFDVPTRWEVLHGEPAGAIIDHIGGRRDVVVAMATRGNAGLRATLLGSVTSATLREAGVPVLVKS